MAILIYNSSINSPFDVLHGGITETPCMPCGLHNLLFDSCTGQPVHIMFICPPATPPPPPPTHVTYNVQLSMPNNGTYTKWCLFPALENGVPPCANLTASSTKYIRTLEQSGHTKKFEAHGIKPSH